MNYMTGIISTLRNVACEVNFYDEESYRGDSFLPFISFMGILAGLVLIIVGFANYSRAKNQWSLFYDTRDRVDETAEKTKRDLKKGKNLMIAGVVCMVGCFIWLSLM